MARSRLADSYLNVMFCLLAKPSWFVAHPQKQKDKKIHEMSQPQQQGCLLSWFLIVFNGTLFCCHGVLLSADTTTARTSSKSCILN